MFQGMNVRQLLDSTPLEAAMTVPGSSWPMPRLDGGVINLDMCRPVLCNLGHLRMTLMDRNKPGIDGYSVAIFGFCMSRTYAHCTGNIAPS